jgi:DNA-binding beta-propeller fold protein YncE
MQTILPVICVVALLLPAWMGSWPNKAVAGVDPLGYTFEQLTPEDQYWFMYVMDVDTDSEGNVYVADMSKHQIVKLSANGEILSTWQGDNSFYPQALSVSVTDVVYVANVGSSSIEEIDVTSR